MELESYLTNSLSKDVKNAIGKKYLVGGTIQIISQNKNHYYQNFGLKSISTQEYINNNSRFYLGSLSKIFTSYAILCLEKQGKLRIFDSIYKYLPELKLRELSGKLGKISIWNLLNHSSGLPFEYRFDLFDSRKWKLEELIETLSRFPLIFSPGSRFQYSNCGYNLLGLILQRITDTKFENYMENEIFPTLGFKDTSYNRNSLTVSGHRESECGFKEINNKIANEAPSGGVISSAVDMITFGRVLFKSLKAKKSINSLVPIKKMTEVAAVYPLRNASQQGGRPGLGFYTMHEFGQKFAFHTGSHIDSIAYINFSLKTGSYIFSAFNSRQINSNKVPWDLHFKTVENVSKINKKEIRPEIYNRYLEKKNIIEDFNVEKLDKPKLSIYEGTYAVFGFYHVDFKVQADGLETNYGKIGRLYKIGKDLFLAVNYLPGEKIKFVRDENNEIDGVWISLTFHKKLRSKLEIASHIERSLLIYGRRP